jgi:hypothetical protein
MKLKTEDGGLRMDEGHEVRSAVARLWRTRGVGRGMEKCGIRSAECGIWDRYLAPSLFPIEAERVTIRTIPTIPSRIAGGLNSISRRSREKFSRDVSQFGRKTLIGKWLIMRMRKWRGFHGLRLFCTGFHRFFMVFSRDFHAEVRWFSRVGEKGRVFYFFPTKR